ncbi:hypothetical protein GALMADRAFT_522220 [Galerina marginata CBS 339.88]|uniref:Uncharacterized protein n=1 Tax=Galerina marginata (strain CBS 339.88) TaxID=685588 RepID=A0A067T548_GALM3|nr:hypothetical protein GALMADRAFT_522220 [Galerina marginata CBS 339.88]
MVVAQLVLRIIITDPTFIDILFRPSDLTIQIISRHWRYARRPPDTALTASTLYVLLDPNHPRQIAYVRSNGLESAAAQIVSKILVGVGPTALSSKQQQVKALLATFAEHLGRLTAGRDGVDQLVFLMGIIAAAKKDATEPELTKAVLKATPLWNAMFRLLKKSAKPATASADSRAESVDPEVEKKYRLRMISDVVGTSANIFHDATFEYPRECEHLARIWANENLFGALEETIELLVTMPGMTSVLQIILHLPN